MELLLEQGREMLEAAAVVVEVPPSPLPPQLRQRGGGGEA
jgi:hypothetical protein